MIVILFFGIFIFLCLILRYFLFWGIVLFFFVLPFNILVHFFFLLSKYFVLVQAEEDTGRKGSKFTIHGQNEGNRMGGLLRYQVVYFDNHSIFTSIRSNPIIGTIHLEIIASVDISQPPPPVTAQPHVTYGMVRYDTIRHDTVWYGLEVISMRHTADCRERRLAGAVANRWPFLCADN